jgi:hypothetical protein
MLMSLRRQIKDSRSPVARFFKELIPSVRPLVREYNERVRETSTLRPPTTSGNPPWGTIGTAIDYRLRYYFGVTPTHDLVAANGARMLYAPPGRRSQPGREAWGGQGRLDTARPNVYAAAPVLVTEFFHDLEQTLADVQPVAQRLGQADEERLCQYCYVLALFDQLFRLGTQFDSALYTLRRGAKPETLLGLAGHEWIDDMCQLSWLFYERQAELLTLPAILNPTFTGSRDIGGADADLIVDNCLIDIKATVNTKLDVEWLYQLLGYVLLDYDDTYHIQSIGVYLARQGELIQWPLDAFLAALTSVPVTVPELRDRFKRLLATARVQ